MKRVGLFLVLACLALPAAASAQDKYPSKPVKILVPYAPGGATDITSRLFGDQFRQILGQQFVVESKPGAFGILAIEEMARSRPDGYTLMVGNVSTNAITPVLFQKKFTINFERDVVSVSRLAIYPSFLTATVQNFEPRSVADVVAYAKKNPGKLRYSSAGVGSFPHFDMEIFARRAGVEMVHLPNKNGAAGMLNDLVVGDEQLAFINSATTASMIKAGKLRPLAVLAEARLAEYPDVPTLAEAGYPGVGTLHWQSMLAPANTPKDVLATLHKAIVQAAGAPALQEGFQKQLVSVKPNQSLDEARTWLAGELASWRKITAEVKIDLTD
ncbi:MAG: tripartite tricarboxylate transporter substrate binding protein [Hyphomicrobiales bacterium]|nr:tripartite tricarboxylate transporter substrate binding protein [Hyphomicrobiales bacterium]